MRPGAETKLQSAMFSWNACITAEEHKARYDEDVSAEFEFLEKNTGERSLTVAELTHGKIGAVFEEKLLPEGSLGYEQQQQQYLAWRGDIGPGKQLRDIIAAERKSLRC